MIDVCYKKESLKGLEKITVSVINSVPGDNESGAVVIAWEVVR